MAVTSNVFQAAIDQALQGNVNYLGTVKMGLLTSAATPNLGSWIRWSDVTNETTGPGYSAGGVTLASATHAQYFFGASGTGTQWASAWSTATTHVVGDVIRPLTPTTPSFGFVAVATSGTGTTAAVTEPTWPLVCGNTVIDNPGGNQIIWSNLGESMTVYSSANAQWTASTFSAAYGVIYYSTGTPSTSPLLCLINFGGTLSPSAGTLTVTPPTAGWFYTAPS